MKKILFALALLTACSKAATDSDVAVQAATDSVKLADDVTAVDAADAVSAADAPSAVTP